MRLRKNLPLRAWHQERTINVVSDRLTMVLAVVKAAGKPVELIVAPDYNHFEMGAR
jgi:hypothetical protein